MSAKIYDAYGVLFSENEKEKVQEEVVQACKEEVIEAIEREVGYGCGRIRTRNTCKKDGDVMGEFTTSDGRSGFYSFTISMFPIVVVTLYN